MTMSEVVPTNVFAESSRSSTEVFPANSALLGSPQQDGFTKWKGLGSISPLYEELSDLIFQVGRWNYDHGPIAPAFWKSQQGFFGNSAPPASVEGYSISQV